MSSDIKFKQYKKSKLKEKQIIHNEDVYQKAKIIIDKDNSRHNSKKKKERVNLIISHIKAITEQIFIDEAQDLDDDAFRIFEILGISGIPIFMIGDPKQAIKYPKAFETFIKHCIERNSEITKVLPINNKSRRIPEELLFLSNRFCISGQCQTSLSKIKGQAYYIASDSLKYHKFIEYCISKKYLIYIEEKDCSYNTHKEHKIEFPIEIEIKLRNKKEFLHLDPDLFVAATLNELVLQVRFDSPKNIIKNFTRKYKLNLEKSEYAELNESLEGIVSSIEGYLISSIDSVKGMESEICVFVLTENTLKYFLQDNLETEKYHNKIWKKIYVALTRSSHILIFALDMKLLPKQDLDNLKSRLEKIGIFDYQEYFTSNQNELPPTMLSKIGQDQQ